ncbi:uncharacterized protein [Fopius arisanus]|uniref:Uncharacterized protein n=1 Tax=Fopius arisanus TaxID=64838 RepID=A0A9R1T7L7_9HYME|nr:PREDICTED: uncharacterized protein LOC105267190 [Fopius arisanus]
MELLNKISILFGVLYAIHSGLGASTCEPSEPIEKDWNYGLIFCSIKCYSEIFPNSSYLFYDKDLNRCTCIDQSRELIFDDFQTAPQIDQLRDVEYFAERCYEQTSSNPQHFYFDRVGGRSACRNPTGEIIFDENIPDYSAGTTEEEEDPLY